MPNIKKSLFFACHLSLILAPLYGLTTPEVRAVVVYDPTNHVQNVLQAARALEQIKIQTEQLNAHIRSLAKSPYNHSQEIAEAMKAINDLTNKGRGLATTIAALDEQFLSLYPGKTDAKSAMTRLTRAAAQIELERQTALDLARAAAFSEDGRAQRQERLTSALEASQRATGETSAIQSSVQALGVLSEQLETMQMLMNAQARLAAQEAAKAAHQSAEAKDLRKKNWERPASPPPNPNFTPLPKAKN